MQAIDRVVLCFFGDGATNEGTFHESMNLAAVWKLPIIFLCVNNQYGMSMSVKQSMIIDDISVRASSYGIPGETIDGNDIREVYSSIKKAKTYVKKQGPKFIVANTYRIMGHSKSDANVYRTKEEVEAWKKRCPIAAMRKYLVKNRLFSKNELEKIDESAAAEIEAAVEFAEKSPHPSIDSIFDDVYA
jgi:pyruvate dehydrogenase E1 component alpha subunit